MKSKFRTALGVVTLGVAVVVASLSLSVGPASATQDETPISTDVENPTYVTDVPEGFEPFGEPVSETDDCITQTVQVYSKTVLEGYEPAVEETFSYGWEERTRELVPGTDAVYGDVIEKETRVKTSNNWGITWSDYSDWTDWPNAGPLNDDGRDRHYPDGAFHSQDNSGKDRWYRQYRYVVVGQFVKVEAVPDSYTDWTPWGGGATGLAEEPTLPENTDLHEYQLLPRESNEDGRPEVPGTEVTYYVYTVTSEGQSCPGVEVTEPFIVTSVSCGAPDSLEVPTQENISFFYGEDEVSGETFYGPLDGTIVAVADEGYALIGQSEWPFDLAGETECPPEETTTTTTAPTTTVAPSTTVTPETSSTSVVAPTTTAPAQVAAPAELAYTGTNLNLFLAGLGLLAVGAVLLISGRRRTA